MSEWISRFWGSYGSIIISAGFALLIGIVLFIVAAVIRHKIGPWLQKKIDKKKHPVLSTILHGFGVPVSFFVKVCGVGFGLLFFVNALPAGLPNSLVWLTTRLPGIIFSALRIFSIIAVAWGLVRSSSTHTFFLQNNKHNLHIGKSFTRFLTAIFNGVVVAFAAVMVITELGYDVSALITGLGLGGLTIALAAKDSAANFFGGLVLVTERPFEIGDWVSCDGIEGTVLDINLRSTKIRTGPGSLTVVPNANLSNSAITNWWSGGTEKRHTKFKISLVVSTPEANLQAYLSAIRTMLQNDPEVQTDSVQVRFTDLAESSLDVSISYYTTLPGYADFLRIKERVNFALMSLAEETGVEFAYPTRTLYVNEK
ncbi:mechanosensitive ion channel family protein [Ruminococcaceae bacterium OttesenSCG-928-A16]|nr:mechanosensitive ion channel family protein [Ruminococcaceae bacterium OttesenSCG-928-A16]